MNLQETVSQITGKNVSEADAIKFANDQFGILTTFLRKPLKTKAKYLVDTLKKELPESILENESIIKAIEYLQTEL